MVLPEEVAAMLRLKELGWGSKRIAKELGISRGTVKRYLAAGGWRPFRTPARKRLLAGEEAWLRERLRQHRGNADVVRQELSAEKGIAASLRTVERSCKRYRAELEAEARACVRFETGPGRQLQIDFGERLIEIGGAKVKVYLFVATLGYSRRCHVRAYRNERQESWLDGLESAFLSFGGVPEEVLMDNARALVTSHDIETRTVIFNEKLKAFARHWGFRPKACAPYRARTKGKIERGVGYVKRNAIAGRSFASWAALEAHLAQWEREIANERVHGTTGDTPAERFADAEKAALKPLADRPPFRTCRTLVRRVKNDCVVEVDGNAYSVPWQLIGETVEVTVAAGQVRVRHGSREVAVHALAEGKRQRAMDAAHLKGVAGAKGPSKGSSGPRSGPITAPPDGPPEATGAPPPALLRPLAEYEAAVGGGF
jgi:transposase